MNPRAQQRHPNLADGARTYDFAIALLLVVGESACTDIG
jgi:hypothetical protein